jgi:hypothetical protein
VGALLCFALLVIVDLQRTNRILLEETLERIKTLQYGDGRRDTLPGSLPSGGAADLVREAEDLAASETAVAS